ncbi:MAG: hypothetical protein JWQ97_3361 [Phenylobacterium sp.]|nr:hypothetical protein [Phenylobacterium sp.]
MLLFLLLFGNPRGAADLARALASAPPPRRAR